MKFGFVKTCMVSPKLKVADVEYNVQEILSKINEAESHGAEIIAFPELSLTSATCGDLFFSDVLLNGAKEGVNKIANESRGKTSLILVGLPLKIDGNVYDVVALICDGFNKERRTCTWKKHLGWFYELGRL